MDLGESRTERSQVNRIPGRPAGRFPLELSDFAVAQHRPFGLGLDDFFTNLRAGLRGFALCDLRARFAVGNLAGLRLRQFGLHLLASQAGAADHGTLVIGFAVELVVGKSAGGGKGGKEAGNQGLGIYGEAPFVEVSACSTNRT